MTQTLRKSEIFMFRLTPEQKKRLEIIADRMKKTPSEMVRDLVLQEIGRQEAA